MTLTQMTQAEAKLFTLVMELLDQKASSAQKDLTLERIYSEYKVVHKHYADKAQGDLESLKRGLFIQWYAITEPDYLSGIREIDAEAEQKIIRELKKRLDQNTADKELLFMLAWYLDWDYVFEKFKNIANFNAYKTNVDLINVKMEVINRGQMGIYWSSILNSNAS